MADRQEVERREIASEADSMVGGPGVVATKSQARGALFGAGLGAVVGAVLGLIVGSLVDLPVVVTIVGAVAGGVFGGVAGGGQNPKQKLGGRSEGDT
jgi:hypothetical protein